MCIRDSTKYSYPYDLHASTLDTSTPCTNLQDPGPQVLPQPPPPSSWLDKRPPFPPALRRSTRTCSTQPTPVSYTHLRAHETPEHLVCRLLLEQKKITEVE
eukprot:TRINITY_DN48285_c0_g1_i1.p1 TRINITY_DN48285_c0_g1~~TRINITY_DN48285_c0_g1_i1.p1  ORF type:complete len:101 (-),score=12.51 TRINITY_DN48285_c0_g1_i1:111-413(-)